jgi:TPR repeat protein
VELEQCSACRQVCYCGKQCQRDHWAAAHRAQCKQFRQLSAVAAKQKKARGGKGLQQESPSSKRSPPQPTPEKARPVDRMQELANQPRKVLDQAEDGGDAECAICLFCMAPAETASLPCGHKYHCECVKQLRERGVTDACPQCRARLPPGPGQCSEEAVRLIVRAERVQHSSGEQARALCAQAAALLEQVLQEEPGHRDAQHELGYCFYKLGDIVKPAQWWRQAAEQGNHARAQFNLALCYKLGEGVLKDAEKAVQWFRKAAEQGEVSAQHNLGCCYDNGEGVRKDAEKAVEWYRKAAELGFAEAQCNLGCCYADRTGMRKDAGKAVEWYRKAAAQGDAQAQCNLGSCYLEGVGVRKDAGKAVEWSRKAADVGHAQAQHNLGSCT